MKSFNQFNEQIHVILGKMGVNTDLVSSPRDKARIDAVKKAHQNKISPYSKKLKPNKIGNPET